MRTGARICGLAFWPSLAAPALPTWRSSSCVRARNLRGTIAARQEPMTMTKSAGTAICQARRRRTSRKSWICPRASMGTATVVSRSEEAPVVVVRDLAEGPDRSGEARQHDADREERSLDGVPDPGQERGRDVDDV